MVLMLVVLLITVIGLGYEVWRADRDDLTRED